MTTRPSTSDHPADVWATGNAYEPYVGRWSRLVAREFLAWLGIPPGGRWLDVGCGTGALSTVILEGADPAAVVGVDPSAGYAAYARQQIADPRLRFEVGDARALPVERAAFDAVVSGLMLNFVPAGEQRTAVDEMRRAARPGGAVAAYVWDYAGEMQLMRRFWDAAVALDPAAAGLDEGRRFPVCRPEPLAKLFREAGLEAVETRSIDVPTVFRDFDDYWTPFLGGQGPAPSYCVRLADARRAELRERLRSTLPTNIDGRIHLIARAFDPRPRARGRV
ncbi:MAG: class I SAM-dependent methyltransferase, partial [Thermomicrobiales bacterium]